MAQVVKAKDLTTNDIIIALMGPTGSGKSTFIDHATRQNGKTIGHGLKSCTTDIRSVRFEGERGRVIFVDTPGFNDTTRSDTEILQLLAEWLEKTYRNNVKLAGIVYLHRISDNRMTKTSLSNLRMFGELCGDEPIKRVVLGTTMWSRVAPEVGQRRQKELESQYWASMIAQGSKVDKFLDSYESAWKVIKPILDQAEASAVLLQEEMVDLQRRLGETSAGVTLYDTLQKSLAEQKEVLRQLQEQAVKQDNPELARHLAEQYEKVQDTLNSTFEQIKRMKVPIGRRILLFFSFKKSKGTGLQILGR